MRCTYYRVRFCFTSGDLDICGSFLLKYSKGDIEYIWSFVCYLYFGKQLFEITNAENFENRIFVDPSRFNTTKGDKVLLGDILQYRSRIRMSVVEVCR